MSARGNRSSGKVIDAEAVVETTPELTKIETTDVADSEALQAENRNVVESETIGEVHPTEDTHLQVEETEDQVNVILIMIESKEYLQALSCKQKSNLHESRTCTYMYM